MMSYIKRSGQSWKIWFFFLLLLAAAASLLVGFTIVGDKSASLFTLFVLGGACLGVIGLTWLSISVRCANCRTNLGWKAIAGETHNNWFFWLLQNEACPVCEDQGTYNK